MTTSKGQTTSVMMIHPPADLQPSNDWAGTGMVAALAEAEKIAQAEILAAESIARKLAVDQRSLANLRPDRMEQLLQRD
jgi:hypothetical protein